MLKSQKFWIIVSSVLGFLGVAFGAFAAHALKNFITSENLEIFKTGVLYNLIHAGVMLSIALNGDNRFFRSEIFFLAGIILFSFTLYLYSVSSIKIFAMIIPVGGACFLAGWGLLILSAIKKPEN